MTSDLYRIRFTGAELAAKNRVWQILCEDFFQRYVGENDRVLDLGAGYCEFINNIRCGLKMAADNNPYTVLKASDGVTVMIEPPPLILAEFLRHQFDVIFASNFFEHLSMADIHDWLEAAWGLLKPGSHLLILGPNIIHVGFKFWDFPDHVTPLSDRSMSELLQVHGFTIKEIIPNFLPYSFKSRFPTWSWIVRLYLKVPELWPIFGRQMFICAVRS